MKLAVSSHAMHFLELSKPRICLLGLLMAALGFFLGLNDPFDFFLFFWTLLGTALIGAGANSLNQYVEQDIDASMWRTLNRPLPSGRLIPSKALKFGIATGCLGVFILLFFVNAPTAVLGALTLYMYVGIYTPAKRHTPLATLIGAIPGALPPLLGWTAARGTVVGLGGILLFGILFLWQIPHFLAIAWMYREDYARAKIPVLTVLDSSGVRAAKQAVLYSLVLVPFSLVPTLWGITGQRYLIGAFILGLGYFGSSITLAAYRTKIQARWVFIASIVYLPVLGILMLWDKQ